MTNDSRRAISVQRRRRWRRRRTRRTRREDRRCAGDDCLDNAADAETHDRSRRGGGRALAQRWTTGWPCRPRRWRWRQLPGRRPRSNTCKLRSSGAASSTTTAWGSCAGCGCGCCAGTSRKASGGGPLIWMRSWGAGRGGAEREPRQGTLVMSSKNKFG